MRRYNSSDQACVNETERLRAASWMLDCLLMNPTYPFWGLGDDCMKGDKSSGWDSGVKCPRWKDLVLTLDDLNEVVNFRFEVTRDSCPCLACSSTGYGPGAKTISDSFYYGSEEHPRWCNAITKEEAEVLVAKGRLRSWDKSTNRWESPKVVDQDFVDLVNASNSGVYFSHDFSHDAINRSIIIETRCNRLGIPVLCEQCGGSGRIFTEGEAHLSLTLWVIHPRKGCSRGFEILRINQEDLPSVFAFLTEAKTRMMGIFSKIPEGT